MRRADKPKWKNERSRTFRLSKDFGWVFAQRLIEEYARGEGLSRDEAERVVMKIAKAARSLLVRGIPFGLPRCPVIYMRRARTDFSKINPRAFPRNDVPFMHVFTPQPLRKEMDAYALDRGPVRDQYEDERLRLSGVPRTKGRYWRKDSEREIRKVQSDSE